MSQLAGKSTTATDYGPRGSDYLGFGKYGAKTYQDVLQMNRDYCNLGRSSGSSTIPLETQEILDVAEDAECIPGDNSGKQHD